MKKILYFFIVLTFVLFCFNLSSCGPSKEEKAKHEAQIKQRRQDSILLVKKAKAERQAKEEKERLEKQRLEEQRKNGITQWLQGTWECSYSMYGKTHTSTCVVDGRYAKLYLDDELLTEGKYEINEDPDRITVNGYNVRFNPYRRCLQENVNGKIIDYDEVSSTNYDSSSYNNNYSQNRTQDFTTDASVWSYLSGKTYNVNGNSVKISEEGIRVNGTLGTYASRITSLSRSCAVIKADAAFEPGTLTIYVYPQQNKITMDGESYYAR